MKLHQPLLLPALFLLLLASPSRESANAQTFKQHAIDAHRHTGVAAQTALQSLPGRYDAWQRSNEVLRRRPALRNVAGMDIDRILAYDALAGSSPKLDIRWDDRGIPIYIEGAPLQRSRSMAAGGARVHDVTVRTFFRENGALLGNTDALEVFALREAVTDEIGHHHLRYAQLRNGVPIWGKEVVCGLRGNGDLDVITGRMVPSLLPVRGSFRISPTEAIRSAEKQLGQTLVIDALPDALRALLGYDGPVAETSLLDAGDALLPVYVVEIRPNLQDRWRLFVDAESGAVLRSYNATCSDGPAKASARDMVGQTRDIDTYLHQGSYYLIDASRPMFDAGASTFPDEPAGAILTLDAHETSLDNVTHVSSVNNSWNDASSVSAHANAGVVYEYFRDVHQRSAIDGKGSTIISVVNVGKNGEPMENAFWNGKLMAYGNGGELFDAFAKALDVATHEMSHGVTEHSAGLEYLAMPGALNEAFSDIFGAMVDREDWKLGEDITRVSESFPTGTMRDLEDPHNGGTEGSACWQPKHMNEFQNLPEEDDNGGVHTNSGIINHCAYLLAMRIGREKTEQIMYRALTTKLTMQSQFIDFRLAIIRSAEELYAAEEAQACAASCDDVGILDGDPTEDPTDIPPVNGADRMLIVNTDKTLTPTLWIAVPPAQSGQDFTAISSTPVWGRPSISDDGTEAMFVDTDHNLRSISLVGAPNEQVLDNKGIWHSVALSRDRKRIAVTTVDRVPRIHLYDLTEPNPAPHSFDVYTPNSSETEIPNTAQFVDAMEFSVDDRLLLFDTYNEVQVQGYDLGFWDVNIMHVWDKAQGGFGTGHIERVLPQDPDINTGNPTFAKTKPMVIAFDAQFPTLDEAYVVTLNVLDGTPGNVVQLPGGTLGYPSFSGDDRLLAFTYTDANTSMIYNLPMNADGVTPAGNPVVFIQDAMVPLWFRTGSRPLSTDHAMEAPSGIALAQNYPNPFGTASPSGNSVTTISFTLEHPETVTLVVTDMLGREVSRLINSEPRTAGLHSIAFNPETLSSGAYQCRLESGAGVQLRSMLLMK
jgi:bacillolysin